MARESEPFDWSGQAYQAAELLARGDLTDEEIAAKVSSSRSTLARWKKHPEFSGKVDEHLAAYRERVRRNGLAVVDRRVDALNDRWLRMMQVIEARAADPSMAGVPGGTTGLLVRSKKALGSGEFMEVVDEYAVDTGLLRELREHEKQAAQELGQWTEKHTHEVVSKGYVTENPETIATEPTVVCLEPPGA